jgi:hypothetical protein
MRRRSRFSRHAKTETLMHYDDNRQGVAGKIARLIRDDD